MKKHLLLSLALFVTGSLMAAPVTVLSNKKVAQGYYPRLNEAATELTYLSSEQECYATDVKSDMYVTTENLKLVLYNQGVRTELSPRGNDANYLWVSLSPDKTKILYKSYGNVGVCDLNGKELLTLGNYNSPVWYGNDYVVAALEENDGHVFTGGAVVILSLDGQLNQVLTDKAEVGMDPSVSYETGQIAYHDFDGNIHLMQISLAGKAIRQQALPALRRVEGVQPKAVRRLQNATQADFKDFKIYINPGHGGKGSDDRGMKLWMDTVYQDYGFWESESNLDKGLHLRDLLEDLGFQVMMSRTLNRDEDDRNLNEIAREASSWGANFMLSIHSNAGGPSNYVLQLFHGRTPGDTRTYPSMPTEENNQKSYEITTIMGNLMMSNKVATWSKSTPTIAGDKTFAADVMGWSDGYGVLRQLTVPGTISEGAMHDYYPETYRLMNMDYKHQEAWYFLKTFCSYYLDYKQTKGVIGGQVRDAYRKQTFPSIKRIKDSRDEQMPVNNAVVELLQSGKVIKTYTTDTLYNGVFFFWDLEPGEYTVRVPQGKYDLLVPGLTDAESNFYGKETQVTVRADEITHVDMMLDAQRSTPPKVIAYEPYRTPETITDSVIVSESVALHFNWDMKTEETEAAFSISPVIDGALTWENSYRTLRFKPTKQFEKVTEYTVTLAKSACHADTNWVNTMEEEFSFKFRTKNRSEITLMNSYPAVGQNDIPANPSFIFIFDESIKSSNANKAAFIITTADGKEKVTLNARSFSFNSRQTGAVTFETTDGLKPNTDYKLFITPKLEDATKVFIADTIVIPFHTVADSEGEGSVMDRMEAASFKYDAEESLGATGSALKYTSKKLFETASNQLKYEFTDAEGHITYTYLNPSLISDANGNCKLGMYIFGDFSENELLAKWVSSDGDIKYTSFGIIDFAGWKYLSADMSTLPADMAYQFMGLRIKRGTGFLSSNGFLAVDNMMYVSAPTALEDVEVENLGVQKVVENDQLIIIKDGVHYNVLGTVIE